jgi:predicted DCC family thiol-disulfide oxidoreductase YuxK
MIVVFDAQCLLCSHGVQFLLKHDRRKIFRFASIQSTHGARLLSDAGLTVTGLETILLVDDRRVDRRTYAHTAALLRIAHALGWPWRAAWLGWLMPAPLRDWAYHLIARNRYRWFGRPAECYMPSNEDRHRFLD